ncbi:MAG TPA: alpha/beta hydrolase [Rhizomicrobium sp.]
MRLEAVLIPILLASGAAAAADNAKSAFTQDDARAIVAGVQKIVSPGGIDEQKKVTINGSDQWITVRGRDRNNPILLFIHGGPGAPEMPTSWTFQNDWEDWFTVVQWDQRGSGKTYLANEPAKIAPTVTVPQMVSDAEAMVRYLRAAYRKDKIFVLGHSWGSFLGLSVARDHPEWLYAYIGMGQIIDSRRSEQLGYEHTLRAAENAQDAAAIAELRAIAPYPEKDGAVPIEKINVERKWSVKYGGLSWGRDSYDYYYDAAKLSPDYTDADRAAIGKGSLLSLTRLVKGFTSADFEHVTRFRCPIIMFNGRHDDTVSAQVTADWFARVHAPVKKLIWFENSAHMMQIEEPGRVLVHLVEDVRPLAEQENESR